MAKKYKQKNLGYKRKPCDAWLQVTFSNDEVWRVPAQEGGLKNYEITDWAANNMNWDELSPYAELVPQETKKFNYEGDWCNANMKVVV